MKRAANQLSAAEAVRAKHSGERKIAEACARIFPHPRQSRTWKGERKIPQVFARIVSALRGCGVFRHIRARRNAHQFVKFASPVFALCLFFCVSAVFPAFADEIGLDITYGYQNTAKAGRFLPLSVTMENTQERTFSGFLHIYMAEAENSVYEYEYPVTVEGMSEKTMDVTVSLNSGVTQLLAMAVDNQGNELGSRRIGLNVASSDAELIVGVLSDTPEALSWLNGISINEGILRTRIVNLDADRLPREEAELDQLDILLVSNFDMSRLDTAEANAVEGWVRKGGVLLVGTGARGNAALAPYFDSVLKQALEPQEMQVHMEDADGSEMETVLRLTASPVQIKEGQELILSENVPMVSRVNAGSGIIAVSGYDFCDIGEYSLQQLTYIDRLLSGVLGQTKLEALSVSASERSLNEYWDIQELLRMGDAQKLPPLGIYAAALFSYTLLTGPGVYFFLKERRLTRIYRPTLLACAALGVLFIWVLGINTRISGTFLNYAKIKTVSPQSIAETDFINLRSPYSKPYELNLKTEYYVYPVLKGNGYNGDITALARDASLAHTTLDYRVDRSVLRVENTPSFTPKYFELTNNMPNVDGSFAADLTLFGGRIRGTITNQSVYSLSDAVLFMYGRLIYIGRLDAGAAVDVSGTELENAAVSADRTTAEHVTTGRRANLLSYYISNSMQGYFSDARLVGFVRGSQETGFTDDKAESIGTTMIVSSLNINRTADGAYEYSAMSRDPQIISGDFNISKNTISGAAPVIVEYAMGEENRILSIRFEALSSDSDFGKPYYVVPFRGKIAFYNREKEIFETVDPEQGDFTAEQLAPYLSERHTLRVRYIPDGEDALARSQYVPMIEVTATEQTESGTAAASAPESAESEAAAASAPEQTEAETETGAEGI